MCPPVDGRFRHLQGEETFDEVVSVREVRHGHASELREGDVFPEFLNQIEGRAVLCWNVWFHWSHRLVVHSCSG